LAVSIQPVAAVCDRRPNDAERRSQTAATSALRSCLYDCSVMHHRLAPKEHHFRYGIFQFCLDLDELDELSARLRLFHRNRPALYRFNDSDHLPAAGDLGTKAAILAWVASQGLPLPADTRVLLLTHCRVFG